jgi:hypothetical protein
VQIDCPKYETLSEKYDGRVQFLKCIGDVDDDTTLLMKREGVRGVPAFHVWKEGVKKEVITGANLQEVERTILDLL